MSNELSLDIAICYWRRLKKSDDPALHLKFKTIDDIVIAAKKGDDKEAYLAAFDVFVFHVNEGKTPPDEIMEIVRDRLQMHLYREPGAIPKQKTKRRDSGLQDQYSKILDCVHYAIHTKGMKKTDAYRHTARKLSMSEPTYKDAPGAIKKVWKNYGKAHELYMKMQSQFEPLNNLMEKYGIMKKEGK